MLESTERERTMYGFNRLKMALQSLAANKMRSAMIVLTLSVVTILLILTISLKAGVEDRLLALMDIFAQPNAGTIWYPDIGGVGGRRSFPYSGRLKDLQLLKSRLGHEASFAGGIQDKATVSRAGRHLSLRITAAEPSFLEIKGWTIKRGSALDQEDEKSIKRVCILTTDVAAILFGTQPSIGGEAKIAGVPFRVKGVRPVNQFVARVSRGSASQVLVPLSTGMKRLWNFEGPEIIHFKARKHFPVEKVRKDITALLRKEHKLVPPHKDDFKILTGENLVKKYQANKRALLASAFGLSLLALLIGVGAAANTMLTALAQRAREFAVKRALGARQADLSLEMILESLLLSMGGFIVGAGVSCGLLLIWQCYASSMAIKRFPLDLTFYAFLVPACLEAAVGLSCGAVVARHLRKIDTAKALRN